MNISFLDFYICFLRGTHITHKGISKQVQKPQIKQTILGTEYILCDSIYMKSKIRQVYDDRNQKVVA